jgi:DNA-binding MarR family transcriptional regulator
MPHSFAHLKLLNLLGTLRFLERPMSMKSLAEHIGRDASNITGIADRLEAKGLVSATSIRSTVE